MLQAERKAYTRFEEPARGKIDVKTIRLAQGCSSVSMADDLERWSKWALAQADRIDPAIGGAFLKAMQDEGNAR